VWARSSGAQTLGAAGVGRLNLLAAFETLYGAQLIGCTVMRIRGVINTASPGLAAGAGNWGRMAAKVEAVQAAPLTAGDGPFTSEHDDWMMFEPFVHIGAVAATQCDGRVIDVKSARKLDELGQELTLWTEARAGNPVSFTWAWDLSIGLKLP
jgi:hypothetical protein